VKHADERTDEKSRDPHYALVECTWIKAAIQGDVKIWRLKQYFGLLMSHLARRFENFGNKLTSPSLFLFFHM